MFKGYMKVMGYVVLTILILSIVGGALKVFGVFGERVVFENSFQYHEGMKQRVNIFEAQIAELEMRKSQSPELANQINAQISVLRVQADAAK